MSGKSIETLYQAMRVCDRIDDALKAKKMSRRELAKAIGLAPSTFQSMMERHADFSLVTLAKMREVLGVDPTVGMLGRTLYFDSDEDRETEFQLVNAWRAASDDDRLVIGAVLKKYGFVYPVEKEVSDHGKHQEN